jgi:hypothetical protein
VKALGLIGNKQEKVVSCLKWVLEHDFSATVKVQVCQAIQDLNLQIAPDTSEADQYLSNLNQSKKTTASMSQAEMRSSVKNNMQIGYEGLEHLIRFSSPLCEGICVILHSFALFHTSMHVKNAAEATLKKLDAYRLDLNLAKKFQESQTTDPNFFIDEATVLRSVKELTTKEAITEYITSN